MYCSFCGKEIPDGSTFCGYCGKKLVYLNDAGDGASYVDGYGEDAYEGLEPVFVAPQWNTYRPEEEWEEEEPEETENSEEAEGSEEAGDAGEAAGDDATADAASESEETESDDAVPDETEKPETDDTVESPGEEDADESTVRRVSKPISDKTYLKEVSANGVHVPSQVVLGESAPRKRVVPIGLVVVVVAAALLAGAASAYAVFQYEAQNGGLIPGLSAPEPEPEPAPYQPAPDTEEPDADADVDEPATPDSLIAEDPTATDEPEAPVAPAVETGFSSAKKLISALQKPLMDGLVANFSDATMRLLVIDELDFMYPAYAQALATEAGCASLQAYSRTVVDEQASDLGKYAGTWSFKLARGSKCSARTIERIQRQFQIAGVDVTIEKANKIEAVTGSYPADYNSKNVDDEGLYHQVTSYTAVQIDGRWYLYTDALAAAGKNKED